MKNKINLAFLLSVYVCNHRANEDKFAATITSPLIINSVLRMSSAREVFICESCWSFDVVLKFI